MKRFLLLAVAAFIGGCSSGSTTEPAANVINIRVVDDTGAGVSRMPITALTSSGTTVRGVTSGNGTVRLGVAEAGLYQVSVVPREGYLRALDPLVRTVSVDASTPASIQFQVWRTGVSTAEHPPEELWW